VKAVGTANAKVERSVVVERALAQGIEKDVIEAAITVCVLAKLVIQKDEVLRFAPGREYYGLPSAQRNQVLATVGTRHGPLRKEARARAYPLVKDVIERRDDGRPRRVEVLDAFADELSNLGYGAFRLWWKQTVAELRGGDTETSPVSVAVLAAALVEGALAFVVRHARGLGLGVLASKSFDGDPRTWRIDDLVSSAAAGRDPAILDGPIKQRAESLIRNRQRIHAGRMLSDFPGGVPDLRPEEARDAKATAEIVVRRVMDWLAKYPAPDNTKARS